jgi:hypothetical protein
VVGNLNGHSEEKGSGRWMLPYGVSSSRFGSTLCRRRWHLCCISALDAPQAGKMVRHRVVSVIGSASVGMTEETRHLLRPYAFLVVNS